MRDIGITRGVDDALGQNRLAPSLTLDDHASDDIAFHNWGNKQSVQHGRDAGFLHQRVSHPLKRFAIDGVAVGLGFLDCGTHVPGTFLELDTNTLGIDRVFVAIPGKAFYADRGDVAAKAPKPFQQGDLTTRAGGTQCGGQAPGAGPHDKDLGFMNNRDLSGGLVNRHWLALQRRIESRRRCGRRVSIL